MFRKTLGSRAAVIAAAVILSTGFGCGLVPRDAEAVEDPYAAAATTNLRGVVAGVVGEAVLLQNHSPEALDNVEIVLNPQNADGGYRFRIASVGANTTNTYLARVFRNEAGRSIESVTAQVTDFAVYADTPRGRGSWRGKYGPNGN